MEPDARMTMPRAFALLAAVAGLLAWLGACASDAESTSPTTSTTLGGAGGQGASTGGSGAEAGAGGTAPTCGAGPDLAGTYAAASKDVVLENQAAVYRWVDVEHDPRSATFAVSYVLGASGPLRTYLRTVATDGATPVAGTRIAAEDDDFCAPCNSGPMDLAFASGAGSSLGLVVFVDDRLGNGNGLLEIWGQLFSVAPGGGPPSKLGVNFDISQTPTTGDDAPAAAYEPDAGRFVAFWSDDRDAPAHPGEDRRDIYGRSVGSDGSLGAEFKLADDARWQTGANAVAGGGRVMVAWTDYVLDGGGNLAIGVRARLVDAAASTTAGPIIELYRPGVFQDPPAIAYDDRACQFLVTWPEAAGPGGMQIAGAVLDTSGAIVRERFVLASPQGGAGVPRLAYDHATRSYLLTFHAWQSNDAFSLELDADGTPVGEPASIHTTVPGLGTFFEPVAAGPAPSFLITSLEDYARIEATLLVAPAAL
jgi:hypothetical protein